MIYKIFFVGCVASRGIRSGHKMRSHTDVAPDVLKETASQHGPPAIGDAEIDGETSKGDCLNYELKRLPLDEIKPSTKILLPNVGRLTAGVEVKDPQHLLGASSMLRPELLGKVRPDLHRIRQVEDSNVDRGAAWRELIEKLDAAPTESIGLDDVMSQPHLGSLGKDQLEVIYKLVMELIDGPEDQQLHRLNVDTDEENNIIREALKTQWASNLKGALVGITSEELSDDKAALELLTQARKLLNQLKQFDATKSEINDVFSKLQDHTSENGEMLKFLFSADGPFSANQRDITFKALFSSICKGKKTHEERKKLNRIHDIANIFEKLTTVKNRLKMPKYFDTLVAQFRQHFPDDLKDNLEKRVREVAENPKSCNAVKIRFFFSYIDMARDTNSEYTEIFENLQ